MVFDDQKLRRSFHDIYPKKAELQVVHQDDHTTFFNLNVIIKERTFIN